MNLYLSRLSLDPAHPRTRRETDRPYELHRTLAHGFADPPAARVLFRLERDDPDRPMLLVQSHARPDWEAARRHMPHLRSWACRDLTLAGVLEGQTLSFRLLCRPAKRLPGHRATGPGGTTIDGRRVVLREPEELLGWMARQGEKHGFSIEECAFDRIYWLDSRAERRGVKEGVDRARTAVPLSLKTSAEPLLGAVRFNGTLTVRHADALRRAVADGIGPQKAFGFGLLSLARAG